MNRLDEALALAARLSPPRFDNSHQSRFWHGVAPRARRGHGMEFWQFRPYGVGDDAGRIDWRTSARYRYPLTKEHEDAVPNSLSLWVDRRPTMGFTTFDRSKQHQADVIALAMAWSVATQGDWVVSVQGKPHQRYHDILSLARDLDTVVSFDSEKIPPADGVILCSDFLYPLDQLRRFLGLIEANQVIAYRLYDETEVSFPYQGRIRFQDLGGGLDHVIDSADALRADYQHRYAAHFSAVQSMLENQGGNYQAHSTTQPIATL